MDNEQLLKMRTKSVKQCGDSLVAWVEFEPGDQIMTDKGLLTVGTAPKDGAR